MNEGQNRKSKVTKSEFIKFPGHAQVSATDPRYEIFAGNGRIELKMCNCQRECECKRGSARLNKMQAHDGSFSVSITNVRKPRKVTWKQHKSEIYAEAEALAKRAVKAQKRMKREARQQQSAYNSALKEYERQVKAELAAFRGE